MAKRRGRHRSLFQKRRGHGHTRRKPGPNGVSLWSVVLSLCFYSLLALIVFALITSKTKEFMDEVVYARVDKSIADPVIIIGAVSFVLIYIVGRHLINKALDKKEAERIRAIGMDTVDTMPGRQFEWFIGQLLEDLGYTDVRITKASRDQGVDIVATLGNVIYAIQCKRQNQIVGNKAIQEVVSGKTFYHCERAAVITNADYSKSAIELARANSVYLWGRRELIEMLQDRQMGRHYRLSDDGEICKDLNKRSKGEKPHSESLY